MKLRSILTSTFITVSLNMVNPVLAQNSNRWIYMGQAATGESIFLDSRSFVYSRDGIRFAYKIGNEVINGIGYCNQNQWYAEGYGMYSPQSQATRNMMRYVCSIDL